MIPIADTMVAEIGSENIVGLVGSSVQLLKQLLTIDNIVFGIQSLLY